MVIAPLAIRKTNLILSRLGLCEDENFSNAV